MADKEFNMEELRRELQEAVEEAEKELSAAAENAAEETTDLIDFDAEESGDAAANAGDTSVNAEDAAANPGDPAANADDAAAGAENDAAENEDPAANADDPASAADQGDQPEEAEPVDGAEEIVTVTTEPLKAEKYEDIEAEKARKAQAEQEAQEAAAKAEEEARARIAQQEAKAAQAVAARQAAIAAEKEKAAAAAQKAGEPQAEPPRVTDAFDKEAITAAVMASHEKVARETEEQALNEVKREKKRKRRRRTARNLGLTFLLLALLAGIAGGAYFYMVRYYSTRFLSGTIINGKDVSGMTASEVKQDLFGVADTYKLTIKERGGTTEELTSKQLGRSYIDNSQVETIMEEQENEKWLFHMSDQKVHEVTFDMAYDKKLAQDAIDQLDCFVGPGITAPKDAKLSTDPDGKYVVTPEEEGNTLDEEKAKAMIIAALDEAAPEVDLEAGDCYLKPEVYRDDERLNKRANAWNAYLSVNVTYTFGDAVETVNGETVRPYITDNGYDVILATDWVKTLVYAWGQKYDSFGLEREFTTHDGTTIKIPAGGDYGWCINKEKTIEDVKECILNGTTGNREPIWLFKAMGWDNNDITGTYCEVSIQDQHLWCYKDGVCVMDTDVVTGKPTPERMTFTGCFAIDGKKKDATLGRLDVQGYASPVSWWLPFNGGEGLHDAPWRSNFGGDIYKSNGSHGCVNIPKEKMETIFNALEIGNAVIVYDDKTPVSSSVSAQPAQDGESADSNG